MIRAFLFTLVWIGMPFAFVKSAAAQNSSGCDGYRYRYTGAFEDIDVQYDIPYGENINVNFVPEQLVVDIYAPAEDANASRPLILMAHGGLFNFGSNDGGDVVELCKDLAHMGYVVASMSYRLGFSQFGPRSVCSTGVELGLWPLASTDARSRRTRGVVGARTIYA